MPINQYLDRQQPTIRPIFVSSYVPRRCGIATFTKDLTKSLNDLNPDGMVEVITIDHEDSGQYYPWEVKYKILKNTLETYFQAAEYVNQSSADIVCLQHEFGLFGGDEGDFIFSFLRSLDKPVVTTLHTVPSQPSESQMLNIQRIAEFSENLVVMIPEAKERLACIYGIDPEKVVVIHHGVADQPRATKKYKKILRWQEKKVILATGLISRDKGFEHVIESLPGIVAEFPETYFYVVGQTHPEVLRKEGERYRNSMIKLAKKLRVLSHVKFINKYLPLEKLLRYFEACDIYVTPHLKPEQISSGTLAYAIGMGKACVSTPYVYAKEMLAYNRGVLVDFESPQEIEDRVREIFRSPELEERITDNAYELGRRMCWPRVAQRYLNLFRYNIPKKYEKNRSKALQLPN